MIKAKELMIGNLVYRDKRDEPVQMILPYFSHLHRLDPIPITEEWLVNFGFQKTSDERWEHNNGHHIVINEGFIYRVPGVSLKRIEHVHDLQNLYFALTQNELELK